LKEVGHGEGFVDAEEWPLKVLDLTDVRCIIDLAFMVTKVFTGAGPCAAFHARTLLISRPHRYYIPI
jgi:hypothetical protein